MTRLQAVVFDMDGLLIDSEPFWQQAETEVFAGVGVALQVADCRRTMGMRIDAVVDHWLRERPWDVVRHPAASVATGIVDRVIELMRATGTCLPGVHTAIERVGAAGLRTALASSSPRRLIDATLSALGLQHAFEVVHSAEVERRGKPAPDVYLTTAAMLAVQPAACLALEDSLAGMRSARAAGMRCVMVPDASLRGRPELAEADDLLESLLLFEPRTYLRPPVSA